MSRSTDERFDDILAAIDRCKAYRKHLSGPGSELADMAFDAILRNLAVIGEAVRALPDETTHTMPEIPWAAIAGLRNVVVHEYFRVNAAAITDIVDNNLTQLSAAISSKGP